MGVYTTKRNQATGDVELIRSAGTIPPSFASLSDDLVINGSKELGLSSNVTTKLSNFNDDGTIASGKPLGNKFDESKDYLIGKNLIDISSMERHTLDGDAGKSTGYITNTRACTAYIPVEGGKTYVLSCTNTDFKFGIWQYFDIDVFDSASGISNGSTNSYFSFTVQNTTKYIKMVFSVASDATKEFALSALVNLQLELGSTPTTYEPFRKSNVELTNELKSNDTVDITSQMVTALSGYFTDDPNTHFEYCVYGKMCTFYYWFVWKNAFCGTTISDILSSWFMPRPKLKNKAGNAILPLHCSGYGGALNNGIFLIYDGTAGKVSITTRIDSSGNINPVVGGMLSYIVDDNWLTQNGY